MNDENTNDDILSQVDQLVSELKNDTAIPQNIEEKLVKEEPLTPERLETYVLEKTQETVQKAQQSLEKARKVADTSGDPDAISAYAGLLKAFTSTVKVASDLRLQYQKDQAKLQMNRERNEMAKQIAELKATTAKQIALMEVEALKDTTESTNNMVKAQITATREEMIKAILEQRNNKPIAVGNVPPPIDV